MVAATYSAASNGIEGSLVKVEAASISATPAFHVTGLPGEIVKESRERVRACLTSLGFKLPEGRLLVHLSPASSKKQGSHFDVSIALSALVAERHLSRAHVAGLGLLGELALDGSIQPVKGAVALIEALERSSRVRTILLPRGNAREASLVQSRKARMVDNMVDILDYVHGRKKLETPHLEATPAATKSTSPTVDDVAGQDLAKRALQIAVAGRHHLLLLGPPGVGKTLLASTSPSLLPPLSRAELIDVSKNYAQAFAPWEMDNFKPPFRSPHHSVSNAGLLGGGSGVVLPGEVTLAHHGVLFLDEFPEYRRDVIEGLREPLQSGVIHIHRVGQFFALPARFLLIAAMNPCPCGWALSPSRRCACSWERVLAYRKRISGAILDRTDLGVVLLPPQASSEASESMRHATLTGEIGRARELQTKRYGERLLNGDIGVDAKTSGFDLGKEEQDWLDQLVKRAQLSYRALFKNIRVARTIADLAGKERIELPHLQEAWALRCPSLTTLSQ